MMTVHACASMGKLPACASMELGHADASTYVEKVLTSAYAEKVTGSHHDGDDDDGWMEMVWASRTVLDCCHDGDDDCEEIVQALARGRRDVGGTPLSWWQG